MDDTEIVDVISTIAQEIEISDRIDWGDLSISEEQVFDLMANEIYEIYEIFK